MSKNKKLHPGCKSKIKRHYSFEHCAVLENEPWFKTKFL